MLLHEYLLKRSNRVILNNAYKSLKYKDKQISSGIYHKIAHHRMQFYF